MFTRPVNLRALVLCLLVVAGLGYAIATSTLRYRPETGVAPAARADLQPVYEVQLPRIESARSVAESPVAMEAPPGRASVASSGPDIAPSATPGVAFAYRYGFQLPGARIVEVQEQHARACEQLGVHRCRITGMQYRVGDGRAIEAMLAVKLQPDIARRFGRAASEVVARAEGMLVESDIGGSDADTAIRSSTRDIAAMREELRRIEQRLSAGQSESARDPLIFEARQLRRSIAAAEAGREDQQESLVTTPMVFGYAGTAPPVAERAPSIADAADRAFSAFAHAASIVAILLVTLLPWALVALLAWLVTKMVMRWRQPQEIAPAESLEAA